MLAAHAVDRSVSGTASNGASSGCGNKAQLRRHDSSAGRIWGWCTRAAQWSSGMSMVIDCSIDHRQQLVRLSLVEAGRQGSLMLTDRANQLSSLCQPKMAYPVLVPVKYTGWAIKVQAILDAQGLWEAVAPMNSADVDERKNKMVRAQLLQALPEDILMQVSMKPTAKEVWDSLKTRFVGADHVKAARLATLKGEFDKLIMEDTEPLDDYASKISSMAVRYAGLGATLDDASMVKKFLDTVPDRLYPAVAGIEQFYDVEMMPFEEALSRLKAFDERSR
jgi:hypothetical protein